MQYPPNQRRGPLFPKPDGQHVQFNPKMSHHVWWSPPCRRDKSVVYFTAKWCPPCRRIGPFFAELSEETPEVSFGKVDIDDNGDAAKMAGIMSVPTFKFYQVNLGTDGVRPQRVTYRCYSSTLSSTTVHNSAHYSSNCAGDSLWS